MARKLRIKKDDQVQVLWGEDKGKSGKILEVLPDDGRVIVDGINIIKKHTKPNRQNPQGGVIEQPGPLHASKVALVCPSCDKPTRILNERRDDGEAIRICKKCGKSID